MLFHCPPYPVYTHDPFHSGVSINIFPIYVTPVLPNKSQRSNVYVLLVQDILKGQIRLLFLRLEKATPSLTWKKTIVRESLETLPDLAYTQQRAHFWKVWECGWPRRSWDFSSTFSLCSTALSHFSGMCSFLTKLSLFLLLLMCLWCSSLSLDTRAWKLHWVSRD